MSTLAGMIKETADIVISILEEFEKKDLVYTSEDEKYIVKIDVTEK